MTNKEAMYIRFSRKNIKKSTGVIAKELGIDRKEFEKAVQYGMNEDSKIRMKEMKVAERSY